MHKDLIERKDLAQALGIGADELSDALSRLNHLGFPAPATLDGDHWAIGELLDWVLSHQQNLVTFVTGISTALHDRQR